MNATLYRELLFFFVQLLLFAFFGFLFGSTSLGLIAGLILYSLFHLRNLARLLDYLTAKNQPDVPDARGTWGRIFDLMRHAEKTRKHKQQVLQDMIVQYRDANAAMPDALVIIAERDEIKWLNQSAKRLLGLTSRDMGMPITNLLRDPGFSSFLGQGDYTHDYTLTLSGEMSHKTAFQIVPFGTAQKLIIGRDVTRLQRLEDMRSNFVANVSHELRTPITVLLGFLETIQNDDRIDAEIKEHLGVMHIQTKRMKNLIDDLLALSKLETKPNTTRDENIDMAVLTDEIIEQAKLTPSYDKHNIVTNIDTDLKMIGDREELRSAFNNLVDNALKHSPSSSKIEISWQLSTGGKGARFSVSDNGAGIDAKHIPHLTERFYRADNSRARDTGGTGLGLSIVKHVLMRHGAELKIDSAPDQGSTFSCDFPESALSKISP